VLIFRTSFSSRNSVGPSLALLLLVVAAPRVFRVPVLVASPCVFRVPVLAGARVCLLRPGCTPVVGVAFVGFVFSGIM
jgi:hypothetical protein